MLMLMMKLPELLKMERHKSKFVSQLYTFSSPAFFLSFFCLLSAILPLQALVIAKFRVHS
jgi:hypothetical protein